MIRSASKRNVAWTVSLLVSLALGLIACGGPGKPPKRGVIERDVDNWGFRRYQSVLDVEVWVANNRGVAHTASYARKSSEKKGRIDDQDVVNAFVTRYKKAEGVSRALVSFARRMSQQSGYKVKEQETGDQRVFAIKGPSEYWVFWAAKKHVIKIGGRGLRKVPEALIEAYGERYPSKLRKGALEGELPEGEEPKVEQEEFDPDSPDPEWK